MTMATISPTGKTLFKDLVLVKSPASISASGGRRLKGHMQVKTCENVLVAFNALSQCPKRNRLHHEGTNRWDSIHNVTLPAKLFCSRSRILWSIRAISSTPSAVGN